MYLKKFFLLFLIVLVPLFTQAQKYPTSFSVQGGYSWINGVVGGDLQVGHFGFSGGWMPTTMPLSGDKISSIGLAGTLYSGEFDSPVVSYVSIGTATNGFRYEDSMGGEFTEAMTIAMIGIKGYSNNWSFKLGGGYGWCAEGDAWTFEVGIEYTLFTNQ
jgi:hypothetical protein